MMKQQFYCAECGTEITRTRAAQTPFCGSCQRRNEQQIASLAETPEELYLFQQQWRARVARYCPEEVLAL